MSQSPVIEMEELYAKRTTVRIEETAAAPNQSMKEATKSNEWLIKITNESEASVKASRSRTKPRIQRVPDLLRKNKDCPELFEPEVVAIGPYHAAKPHLRPMEEHKKAAAKQLAAAANLDIVSLYDKVSGVADTAKDWYAELPDMTDKEFVDMMFFDACFLLHFIHTSLENETKDLITMVYI